MKFIYLSGLLAIIFTFQVSAQSLLQNYGFENPNFAGVYNFYASSGSTVTVNGWTYASAGGNIGITPAGTPWTSSTPEGLQVAIFQSSGSISQSFTNLVATNFYVSFYAANRPSYSANNLTVTIDGNQIGYYDSSNFTGGIYLRFTTNVFLASGSHTINFTCITSGGDTTTLLDDVLLQQQGYAVIGTNTFLTDGTDIGAQQAINSATNGAVIFIPAGNYCWTNGIQTGGKALTIVGAGAGYLFGNSASTVTVGTGSKTFVVASSPEFRTNGSAFNLVTNGQVVTAYYTASGDYGGSFGNAPTNMTGTVTSFDGTNLVLNVTNALGGYQQGMWTFGTASATVITNYVVGQAMVNLTCPANGSNIVFTGLRMIQSGLGNGESDELDVDDGAGFPLIHDCWFSVGNVGARAIEVRGNHGIIYRCSLDNRFDGGVGHNGLGNNDGGITFKCDALISSWTQNSTMGTNDTNGTNNFYIEDCYECGFWTGGTDFDDNSRVVWRHCIFDQSVASSHGQETSPYGVRHFELYNNTFVFTDDHSWPFNLNWWLFLRGGTGVIFSNIMPDIVSSVWGEKNELTFTVMYPYRDGCITNYPAPHQIGQSYSNGVIIDPVYYWSNAQLPTFNNPGLQGYTAGQYDSCYAVDGYPPDKPDQSLAPPISWYLQAGREFTNIVKAAYAPYTYPHPLRVSNSLTPPVPPVPTPSTPVQFMILPRILYRFGLH